MVGRSRRLLAGHQGDGDGQFGAGDLDLVMPFFLAALSALNCFLVSFSVTVVDLPLASARRLACPAIFFLPLPPL